MTIEEQVECGSITRDIRAIQSGSLTEIGLIFDRYFKRISKAARTFFGGSSRSVLDEEDVALAVIHAICSQEKLDGVEDREALIRLLLVSAKNKVRSVLRASRAEKRGEGFVTLYADLNEPLQIQFANLQSSLTNPQIQAALNDGISQLLKRLEAGVERDICRMRLRGETIESIAERLNTYPRKINRKIALIQAVWLEMNDENRPAD